MTGSRLLNGTSPVHLELEEALADFLGAESAIVFSTGYLANLGTVSALVDRHGVSVLDRDVHASIYDAAGLALGKYVRFQHNDAEHLARVLDNLDGETPRLVIVDGAYSMGGDLAPLPALREVCERRNTRLLVDDAHAIGTVGPRGRGTHSHFGLDQGDDLIIGTFSKTLASVGGFCAGPQMVIEYVQHFSRPMLFTAALPPASAAAALAALRLIDRGAVAGGAGAGVGRANARPARGAGLRCGLQRDADHPDSGGRRGAHSALLARFARSRGVHQRGDCACGAARPGDFAHVVHRDAHRRAVGAGA